MVTVEGKREAVVFLKTGEVSQRRSCQLILLARSTCQYTIKRQPDEKFETRSSNWRSPFRVMATGEINAPLRRRGQTINRQRIVSVWQKFGLQVSRSKQKKKRLRQGAADNADRSAPESNLNIRFCV